LREIRSSSSGRSPATAAARQWVATNSTFFTVLKVGDQRIGIRSLGGALFEVLNAGKNWSLDSTKDNGDFCAPADEPEDPSS
jgi:hypothetical protein